jgi:RecA-family ATPase
MTITSTRFYSEAMNLSAQDYPVFPCNGKIPAIPSKDDRGNELGHGCEDATSDEATIRTWSEKYPNANVGITFRHSSKEIGIDIDKDTNFAWLDKVQREHGIIETKSVKTGNDGLHLYFLRPKGVIIPNISKSAGKGYEVKSHNQYLMAPGTIHPETKRVYELINDIDPQPLPDWLLQEILHDAGYDSRGNGRKPVDTRTQIFEHQGRNAACAEQAGRLLRIYKNLDVVKVMVKAYNEAVCTPPLSDEELEKTVFKSMGRWAAKNAKEDPKEHAPEPKTWTVKELLDANIPEISWRIENLIPDEALIALGGRKKLGKTWLGTQIGTAVATGGDFLGYKCIQGSVLLLTLEDGERRLRRRLKLQKTPKDIPLYIKFDMAYLDKADGGLVQLKRWIEELKPCLIIIDTLAKALSHKLDQNSAGETAEIVNALHSLTIQYHLVIIIIAHHGKMSYGDSGMDLRGSSAIPGATDGNFGLYRQGDDYFFKGESRDIEEFDLRVFLDKENSFLWQLLGETKRLAQQLAEQKILDALTTLVEADASQIASETGMARATVAARCKKMRQDQQVSFRVEKKKILYTLNNNKSSTSSTYPTDTTTPTSPTLHKTTVEHVEENTLFGNSRIKPKEPCPTCHKVAWEETPDGDYYCALCAKEGRG